jgi:hypothetical protein
MDAKKDAMFLRVGPDLHVSISRHEALLKKRRFRGGTDYAEGVVFWSP